MRGHRLVSVVAIALAVAACQLGPTAPSPSPTVVASPFVEVPPTQDELEAIAFRTDFGLPAELAFVRAVAANPDATLEFGVPLLPAEVAELVARGANSEAVQGIVLLEAEQHPEDYCGSYVDNQNGGALTSMWRANLAVHSAAILFKVGPAAHVAFVGCTYSETELNRVTDLLNDADRAWMAEIPALATGWGPNTSTNRIEMEISSAIPGAADVVRVHFEQLFGLPRGMLVVTSDGTGAALVPRGTINVFVTKPNGKPLGPNDLYLDWTSKVAGLSCGEGAGYLAPRDDRPVQLPCQAGRWTIRVASGIGDVYGEGHVTVRAAKTVDLHITLTRNPPPLG
jgi:hypothetical protein